MRRSRLPSLLPLLLVLPSACGDPEPKPAPPSAPTPEAAEPVPEFRLEFADVTARTGIDHVAHFGRADQKDWVVTSYGGGVACLDYDGDGDQDLFFVDGLPLTSEGFVKDLPEAHSRLYRNDGEFRFTDVTEEAGALLRGYGGGVASADYDADGDDDLFVAFWGENRLLRNEGDGTFVEVAAEAGVLGGEDDDSTGCAFGDVDGDGHLDLFVVNYVDQTEEILRKQELGKAGRSCLYRGLTVFCGPIGLTAQYDRLYLGNGDGTFRDVSQERLTEQIPRYGFQVVLLDVDADGDLDAYVANDTHANTLWLNDGKGVFDDVGAAAGVAMNADGEAQAGMGIGVGDADRDGKPDLLVTNFSTEYHALYVNRSPRSDVPRFRDFSYARGLGQASYDRLAWGALLSDFDGDRDLDSFVACGHVFPEIDVFAERVGTTYEQRNQLFRNEGPPHHTLVDVTPEDGPLGTAGPWRGAIAVDLDDDGDPDVVVTRLNGPPMVLENRAGSEAGYLRVRLVGENGRRDPAGAAVTVTYADGSQATEWVLHGSSFCSDGDPRLHFGLAGDRSPVDLTVRWPDGSEQTHVGVDPDRLVRIVRGNPTPQDDRPAATSGGAGSSTTETEDE